ncbi:MAG: hypothetical protein ACQZ2J_08975 [Pseudomonas piscis]|uniref:hypothetical protein n=1 Tax=Pseudomonas piscis TaxID=2614538 RepID=UPI003D297FDD
MISPLLRAALLSGNPSPFPWFDEVLDEGGTGGFRSWAVVGFMGETLFSHEPPGPEQKLCQCFAVPYDLDLSFKNNCLDTERKACATHGTSAARGNGRGWASASLLHLGCYPEGWPFCL